MCNLSQEPALYRQQKPIIDCDWLRTPLEYFFAFS